jgi:hypothetical protein
MANGDAIMNATKKKAQADRGHSAAAGHGKLKGKDYDRELARLHVELVKLQQWVKHEGAKICVVQGDRRARQPARVSCRRLAGADRTREVADVCSALHSALAGSGRDRDL